MKYHLAQYNVAKALYPVDDPRMIDFVSEVDNVNALADGAPGFVWRLHDDGGNSLHIYPYGDELLLVTFSVWESVEDVFRFTYQGMHARRMQDRSRWFEHISAPYIVLWWIPAGHIPTLEEAKERLEHLRQHGPSPHAFDFKTRFAVPVEPEMPAFPAEGGARGQEGAGNV